LEGTGPATVFLHPNEKGTKQKLWWGPATLESSRGRKRVADNTLMYSDVIKEVF